MSLSCEHRSLNEPDSGAKMGKRGAGFVKDKGNNKSAPGGSEGWCANRGHTWGLSEPGTFALALGFS